MGPESNSTDLDWCRDFNLPVAYDHNRGQPSGFRIQYKNNSRKQQKDGIPKLLALDGGYCRKVLGVFSELSIIVRMEWPFPVVLLLTFPFSLSPLARSHCPRSLLTL